MAIYNIKDIPESRLPATVDRAVWENITKGRGGIRWDKVVENILKDLGGGEEEVLPTYREVWRIQDKMK